VKIGLEIQAYELYKPDLKKYELENPNPKGFLDTNQLVMQLMKVDWIDRLLFQTLH
jgi:hypothetical protein